jgi:putative membrane protein
MMKRINYKKRAVIHGLSMAVFLGACLGVQANDNDEKGAPAQATVNSDRSNTSSDRSRDQVDSATTDRDENGKLSRGDANFIKEAAQGGLMEVKLGQTAKDHGSSADVKNYGEMLVKDHSKANERLSQLASQKGVNLAKEMEAKHTDTIKDMEKKSGADFDRAFIEHAVKDHRKNISRFERASRDLNDSELKAFAMETLPTLRAHLAEAERIARSLGVNVVARNLDTDADRAAASSAGAPGSATSSTDSSVNRVDVDIDRDKDAKAEGKVEIDTDKGDGKTLGVDTKPGDGKTLGVETEKGDGKVLGIETKPGDGKTLGLNTRKDDGKLLGVIPAPGQREAENTVDVDVDKSDHSVEVDANVGAPATGEKGTKVEGKVDVDDKNAKTLAFSEVPAKVQETIRAQGGSSDLKVKKHTMNGKVAYKVEIKKDGRNRTLHIAEDGKIIKDNN